MTWLQLRFVCDALTAAQLDQHLSDCGALAVSLDDAQDQPVYEPETGTTPLWSNTRVTGLFPGAREPVALLAELERRLAPARLPVPAVSTLEDQEWLHLHRMPSSLSALAAACG